MHELAHALIPLVDQQPVLSYAEEELVVESVAWCVCDTAGLDTSANSIPYLTSWSATASLEVLQQTAELVDRLAREIEAPVLAALDPDNEPVQRRGRGRAGARSRLNQHPGVGERTRTGRSARGGCHHGPGRSRAALRAACGGGCRPVS